MNTVTTSTYGRQTGLTKMPLFWRPTHLKLRPKGITKADAAAEKSENLLQQEFSPENPNEKWLTDITEIPCKDAKLYLAPVLDCYDGTIRGFKMDTNMRAELCVEAFERACGSDGAGGRCILNH